jgi:hypothetical protein
MSAVDGLGSKEMAEADHNRAKMRKEFAKLKASEFSRFLDQIIEDVSESTIKRHLYLLFFKMYEMQIESKFMSKAQACRFIPLRHAASCQKYLEEARKLGYLEVQTDERDKRRQVIRPGQPLLDFVEEEIDRMIFETYLTMKRVERQVGTAKLVDKEMMRGVRLGIGSA